MSASDVIARLRELRAKATAGDWELDPSGYVKGSGICDLTVLDATVAEFLQLPNAAAIVAAMNSLPALLDAAEALQGVEQLLGEYIDHKGTVDATIALAFETTRAALQALAEGGVE